MLQRPSCVVNIADIPAEPRPRYTATPGVAAMVRSPGDKTGLTRMGVHVRAIEPGLAGTNRHFHTVEEEWSYVLAGKGTVRIGPLRIAVRAGSFVGFPPGPRPHHFLAEGTSSLVLLEGGERRPSEDSGWYPDARKQGFQSSPSSRTKSRRPRRVTRVKSSHSPTSCRCRNCATISTPRSCAARARCTRRPGSLGRPCGSSRSRPAAARRCCTRTTAPTNGCSFSRVVPSRGSATRRRGRPARFSRLSGRRAGAPLDGARAVDLPRRRPDRRDRRRHLSFERKRRVGGRLEPL